VPNRLMEIDEAFRKQFDRGYGLYETYRIEDADFVMVTMGAIASTAKVAVDELRREGKKVGLFKPRLFRPPPIRKWRKILSKPKVIVVVDRAISFGSSAGPLLSEILGVFMNEKERPLFTNYIAGIGGRDVTVADLKNMFNKTINAYEKNKVDDVCKYYGVRE
jgi:pyruvate ferredoxin oxidoreductase alpha subunit